MGLLGSLFGWNQSIADVNAVFRDKKETGWVFSNMAQNGKHYLFNC